MSLSKVYKEDVKKISRGLSDVEKNHIIEEIILLVRNNPNNSTLGKEVDKYIKRILD